MTDTVRIDKWLWAVRLCKTRGTAAELCNHGKVKRGGKPVKPAAPVHPSDLLEIPFPKGPGLRTVRVLALIQQRVGAPAAQACYEDLTPAGVFEALREWVAAKHASGKGRPTKRDRRKRDRIHWFHDG